MIHLLLRVLVAIAAAVPTAMVAGLMAFDAMWILVFGDDPWPAWSEGAVLVIAR